MIGNRIRALFLALTTTVSIGTWAQPRASDSEKEIGAVVTWFDAGTSLGKVLLVKKGNKHCAVRFTSFERGKDASPSNLFSSGEETQRATYEWYYQGNGTGNFAAPTALRGTGHLSRLALVGLGRLAFRRGTSKIPCGDLTLEWMPPTRIKFDTPGDGGTVQIAPTAWSQVDHVQIESPLIVWYSKDEARKEIDIPMNALAQ